MHPPLMRIFEKVMEENNLGYKRIPTCENQEYRNHGSYRRW